MRRGKFREVQYKKQVAKAKGNSLSLQMKWNHNLKSTLSIETKRKPRSKSESKGRLTRSGIWKLNVSRCTKSLKRQCLSSQQVRLKTKARARKLIDLYPKPTTISTMHKLKRTIRKLFSKTR